MKQTKLPEARCDRCCRVCSVNKLTAAWHVPHRPGEVERYCEPCMRATATHGYEEKKA